MRRSALTPLGVLVFAVSLMGLGLCVRLAWGQSTPELIVDTQTLGRFAGSAYALEVCPTLAGTQRLYISDQNGNVHFLDLTTNEWRGFFVQNRKLISDFACGNGVVYFSEMQRGFGGDAIVAVNEVTGTTSDVVNTGLGTGPRGVAFVAGSLTWQGWQVSRMSTMPLGGTASFITAAQGLAPTIPDSGVVVDASAISLTNPFGVAFVPGSSTSTFVSDNYVQNKLRRIFKQGGIWKAQHYSGDGWAGFEGEGTQVRWARWNVPTWVKFDGPDLYVFDSGNGLVRRIIDPDTNGQDAINVTVLSAPEVTADGFKLRGMAVRDGVLYVSTAAAGSVPGKVWRKRLFGSAATPTRTTAPIPPTATRTTAIPATATSTTVPATATFTAVPATPTRTLPAIATTTPTRTALPAPATASPTPGGPVSITCVRQSGQTCCPDP